MMSLTTPEGLSGLLFLGIVALTLTGGFIAVQARRLIRAVAGLALCFIGVAGLYYYLNGTFVALMEILIYVGAVCVTIVFAVMLASPDPDKDVGPGNALVGGVSLFVGAMLFWGLSALALKTMWPVGAAKVNNGSMHEIGISLLSRTSMVFELISVVLLVAIIGALVLARSGRDK